MKQLEWVNVTKGIAIIAVVLSHTVHGLQDLTLFPIKSLAYEIWFVSVFFVLGGFFIKEEKLCKPLEFTKGKMKSLYSLLLYFYIPAVLLHNLFLQIGFYDTTTSYGGKYMSYWEPITFIKEVVFSCCFMGREPILGAMWFVYVLLLALIGFSFSSFIIKKIFKKNYEIARATILLFFCIMSCSATNILQFTIPRFNNVLTAMWLIYCGYILNQYIKVKYNNKWVVIGSGVLVYHIASIQGGVALNGNIYPDVLSLTISSAASLYIICYFAKIIENNIVGKCLSYCGKESFYIMALHFMGFKVMSLILNLFGFNMNLSSLMAPTNKEPMLVLLYVLMGIIFPLAFMAFFRKIKNVTVNNHINHTTVRKSG